VKSIGAPLASGVRIHGVLEERTMHRQLLALTTFVLYGTFGVAAQTARDGGDKTPLYRVTVIERTVKAVDYQYRNGPTTIDLRGTVLLPEAKGQAIVESKPGRTEIDARFDRMRAPTRFGPEYLTYVLWAITPQGHAKNIGEVLAGHSDKASLHVSTDFQAFALIVTAEPYSAVRQPSDVVVMENEIRPDTVGHIEPIDIKAELLPRGHYTYAVPKDMAAADGSGPKVPVAQYEALLEVYQAQNAVQIARAAGADRYAADTLHKAEAQLQDAQRMQAAKVDRNNVVTAARAAAQTAEDARAITLKRQQEDEVAQAREQAAQADARRREAEAEAQRAKAQASADRMQLEQERAARQQAEARAAVPAAAPAAPIEQPMTAPAPLPADRDEHRKVELRSALLREVEADGLRALDSPRGIVITIAAGEFEGGVPAPSVAARLMRLGSILASQPGLLVEVSGNGDESERLWRQRAEIVSQMLIRDGAPAQSISTRYLGSSRPVASNASASGREQNRRVEITISGDAIGNMAHWDKP